MNNQVVRALVQKDLKSTFSSKKVWVPMVIVSLLICTILPLIFAYIGTGTELLSKDTGDTKQLVDTFIKSFPENEIKEKVLALPNMGLQFLYLFFSFMIAPFFLLVSVINSMVTASNSFAGEKERKTLESLLFAPISVKDLFLGKVLASFIPTMIMTYIVFILDIILINLMTYSAFNEMLFLSPTWLVLMLWVVPILVLFNILVNVLISAKVKTFQEAQQFAGLLILPIIGIFVGQISGLFFINPMILFILGFVLLIGNLILLKLMAKFNQRNALFESQIH
ncbi:MAG TPA: ABC transporter permease subunit [Pseudoneobacillus sp.]|nr:ABC transporter permease subunit [Pseudoneobacillus sp.]